MALAYHYARPLPGSLGKCATANFNVVHPPTWPSRDTAGPAIIKAMATVQLPKTRQRPTKDPHHAVAVERGKAAVRKLQERGIIDSQGRRIRTDLPADMKEGEDRDFGA